MEFMTIINSSAANLSTNSNNSNISDNSSTSFMWENDSEKESAHGFFEGPEKTLEVVFNPKKGMIGGLRTLNREQLDVLCTNAKCTIISNTSTDSVDSYVLSESSLFVYEHRYIMKTCGTTTLLCCLSALFEYTDAIGMEFSWLSYSRKNYNFPGAQQWPHVNFGEEIRYIEAQKNVSSRLEGHGYILGPVTGDHWFVFAGKNKLVEQEQQQLSEQSLRSHVQSKSASDRRRDAGSPVTVASLLSPSGQEDGTSDSGSEVAERRSRGNSNLSQGSDRTDGTDQSSATSEVESSITPSESVESLPNLLRSALEKGTKDNNRTSPPSAKHASHAPKSQVTLNMMMFDMAAEVAETFFESKNGLSGKQMTVKSGIQALCPKATIDEKAFSPCGYSMNALEGSTYYTIHITPEAAASYVSFETNLHMEDYTSLVTQVLATFKPGRFVLTLFGEDKFMELNRDRLSTLRTHFGRNDAAGGAYVRCSTTCTKLDVCEQRSSMACYRYHASAAVPASQITPLLASSYSVKVAKAFEEKKNLNLFVPFQRNLIKSRAYSMV